jgi:hypothetical protein
MSSGLGEIFGTESFSGPLVVQYLTFRGVGVYLIGERHNTNGSDVKNTVVEHLHQYDKRSPQDSKLHCYCELSERDAEQAIGNMEYDKRRREVFGGRVQDLVHIAESPIQSYIAYRETNRINGAITHWTDIRNVSPYYIYTLITYPDAYRRQRYGIATTNDNKLRVRRFAKMAEKVFFANLATRAQSKHFLNSLYHPDKDYPEWFVTLFKKINDTHEDPPSPLKDMVKQLRDLDATLFDKVVQHVNIHHNGWDIVLLDMASFLVDVHFIVDVLLKISRGEITSTDNVVFFCGLKHCESIGTFMHYQLGCNIWHKIDLAQKGDIKDGDAKQGPFRLMNPVVLPLKNLNKR